MNQEMSRRMFLGAAASAAAGTLLCHSALSAEDRDYKPPVVIFSKVYQSLKLDFDQTAQITAEVGIDGIDCPVRKGGQIEPERAVDELPRYVEILARHKLTLPMIATGIVNASSPNARDILTTARKAGVGFYRIGFVPPETKVAEFKPQLSELAAMNKEIGITGVLENHTSPNYLGGNLNDMLEMVSGFDPAQIAVALDPAHAMVQHGNEWSKYFELLTTHIQICYIKDVKLPKGWVPFGQGDLGKTDFFRRLRALNRTVPLSLHMEYDWTSGSKSKTRDVLAAAIKASNQMLHQWLAIT